MRKGYDGLSGLVRNELGADPLSGDVYVFFEQESPDCQDAGLGPGRICGVQQATGGGLL
ncbi:MAG: IS66 family insertion sequence element accessory protein TnpB [Saprospiraceae bacterium]|nr:IS66 family insertion sequence element accessory protein TnpB [Saprospiraceae bacterium]